MATRYFPPTSSPFYSDGIDPLQQRADAFAQDISSNLPDDLVTENPAPDWANDPIFQRASAFSDDMEQFLATLPDRQQQTQPAQITDQSSAQNIDGGSAQTQPSQPQPQRSITDPLQGELNDLIVQTVPTAGLGQLAKMHSATDKAIAETQAQAGNVEVSGEFSAFGDRVQEVLNSPTFWDASPKDMMAEVNRIAKEEFGNPDLAKKDTWNFDELAKYRETQGVNARPSPFGFVGEKTNQEIGQDAPDIVQRTRQHLAKGSAGLFANENYALQAVQEALGIDSSKARARSAYYDAISNTLPSGTNLNEIKSLGDALGWAYNSMIEQAPNLAVSIAGGALGATLIRGSIGARIGAFGSSYMLELGQIEQGTKDLNPDQKAGLATFLGAAPAAALDALLPGKIGSQLIAKVGEKEANEIALRALLLPDRAWLRSLGSAAGSVAEGVAIEGSTEGTQQAIEEISSSIQAGKPITPGLLYRMVQAGATGAVAGGPANVIGDVAERSAVQNAPIDELANTGFSRSPGSVATELFQPQQGVGNTNITPRPSYFPEARPITLPVEARGGPAVPVVPTMRPTNAQGGEQQILIPNGPITSRFGRRHSFPTVNGQMASSNHAGVDIGLPEGAKVPAAADGVVVFAGQKGGYGNAIVVKFSDGTSVLYGHLSRIGVEVGDQVAQGETIGRVGHTGNATGPHLHFERRDAQGRPVNPFTARMVHTDRQADGSYIDNTGFPAEPTEADYGEEDNSSTQTSIDDTYEQATGQSLREPQIDTLEPETQQSGGVRAVAEAILGQPTDGAAIASAITNDLSQAQASHTQSIMDRLMSSTTMATQPAPELPQEAQQPGPLDLPAPPPEAAQATSEAPGQQTFDYTQPLPDEQPVFGDDQQTVVGFINDSTDAFRPIGKPPGTATTATPETTGTNDFVAAPFAEGAATTPVATESSAVETAPEGALPRLIQPPAVPFGTEQTSVAYEVAPGSNSPLLNRWRALSMPDKAKITTTVNRLVMPPILRKLNMSAQITGHLGGWMGEVNPSVTLSTRVHFNALTAARYLGHALNQDAVMVLSERPVPNLEQRGAAVVQIPESEIPAAYQKLTQAGLGMGFTTTDKGMVFVNYSDIPTEELARKIDAALDGAYNVWSKNNLNAALVERGGDDYGLQGRMEGQPVERADLDRLAARAGESLVRNIERAEGRGADANAENGGSGAFRFTPELEKPTVSDGHITLDHFGPAGLTKTDPSKWGQNAHIYSQEERNYLASGIPRTYFGISTGRPGGYIGEFPSRVHYTARVPADKLYDAASDPDKLSTGKPWLTERAIRDAGYAGYWLKDPNLGLVAAVFEPVKLSKAIEKSAPRPQLTPQKQLSEKAIFAQKVRNDVLAAMSEMRLLGRSDLGVELVSELEKVQLPDGRVASQAAYYYRNVIKIAAVEFPFTNPRMTFRHESIHWARQNIFTNLEWDALAKWAKNNPSLMTWAKMMYPDEPFDIQVEEAVAEGFARWSGGNPMNVRAAEVEMSGLARRALIKLKEIIGAIQRAFGLSGISQAEINEAARIMREFETGQTVQKFDARKAAERARKFGRKPTDMALSRALAEGRISADEYNAARSTAPRFQTAWHGTHSPAIDQFKLDFIGTGEGAQAYGWGLYFTQSKEVAEYYRESVSRNSSVPEFAIQVVTPVGGTKGKGIVGTTQQTLSAYLKKNHSYLANLPVLTDVASRIRSYLSAHPEPKDGWLASVAAQFEYEMNWAIRDAETHSDYQQWDVASQIEDTMADGLAIFDVLGDIKGKLSYSPGGLYEVTIPDHEHLLVYEKRLKDQPPTVKEALAKVRDQMDKIGLLAEKEEATSAPFWEWEGAYLVKQGIPHLLMRAAIEDQYGFLPDDAAFASENSQEAKATSLWLRSLGVPGHRYLDQFSRGKEAGTYNYVIYDDNQISINARYQLVDDTLLSDPSIPNAGIFNRAHTAVMGMLTSIGGKNFDPTDRLVDAWKRKVVNKFQSIINTQKRVAKELGVAELPPELNPYLDIATDERGYKLNFLADNYVKPLAQEMAQRNVSLDDLGLYLYARHAPFRNARIAAINPEFNLTDKPGSGMTNKEAANILKTFADDGRIADLEAVAKPIDDMIQLTQDEMKSSGLIGEKELAQWFKPEEYYVPLKGNEALEPDVEFGFAPASLKGGGFSVSGREIHRMFGRASKADLEGIVGNVVTQAQMAADRGYRNQVGYKIMRMLDAVGDKGFATIDRVKRVPVWNKTKGIVEYQIQKRVVDPEEQARTLYVKVDGVDHKITFNQHNPSAMRFVKAAKNLDMASLNRFLQVASGFTRLWSSLQTTYNAEFLVRNAARDVQTALVNSQAVEVDVSGLGRSIAKNIVTLKPLMAAWQGAFHDTGKLLGSAKEWNAIYAEFEANGGKLNYNQVQPVEDALRTLAKEYQRAMRGKYDPRRLGLKIVQTIDHANSAIENMTRLAAYKALRDRDIEAKVAAKIARELTTNFAQHGEWGPTVNALYGFGNATIIGGARLTRTIVSKPWLMVGLFLAGFLQDFLNDWFNKDEWDQYSEEDKDYHWTILLPDWLGVNVHIPMGYGINSFVTVGRKISELMRGKKNPDGTKQTVANAMGDVFSSFANAWSPVQGYSFWNIISPSLLDPFVDIIQNKNHWGSAIMPSQPDRLEQQKPDSQLAFDNTGQFWKSIAQGMNSITGGNEVVPGLIDVSPESIKHVVTELGGGATKTAARTGNFVEKVATGNTAELGPNDIPFARAFVGRPYGAANTEGEVMSAFYDRVNAARKVIGEAKEMKARFGKDSQTYQDFRKANEPIINFYPRFEAYEKKLAVINAADNAAKRGTIRADGLNRRDRGAIFKATQKLVPQRKLSQQEVDDIRAAVRDKRVRLAKRFNQRWLEEVVGEQ